MSFTTYTCHIPSLSYVFTSQPGLLQIGIKSHRKHFPLILQICSLDPEFPELKAAFINWAPTARLHLAIPLILKIQQKITYLRKLFWIPSQPP